MVKKRTNKSKGLTIGALIFDTYKQYIEYNYPKDPNIYVVRAHPETIRDLIVISDSYLINKENDHIKENTFMGFRLESNDCLEINTVVFGPETVELKWSK